MSKLNEKMTNYRWVICSMLFFATTVNYLDRQVLSLLQPILEEEFHWTDNDYGSITAVFSLFYAVSMLFAGRFVDRVGTKKGYAWSIAVWSLGAAFAESIQADLTREQYRLYKLIWSRFVAC